MFKRIGFLLICAMSTAGCALHYAPSKDLVRLDKQDFDLAKKEWAAYTQRGTFTASMGTKEFNKRVEAGNAMISIYARVLQNRDNRAAYSKWLYAAWVRMAKIHEDLGDAATKLAAKNRQAGKKLQADHWDVMQKKAYKKSFRSYTVAAFMGHYFHKHLPGDPRHTAAGNKWLQDAMAGSQRAANKLGMRTRDYVKAVMTLFDRGITSGRSSVDMQPRLVSYLKAHPLKRN